MITLSSLSLKFKQVLHSCSLIQSAWVLMARFELLRLSLGRYGSFWVVLDHLTDSIA